MDDKLKDVIYSHSDGVDMMGAFLGKLDANADSDVVSVDAVNVSEVTDEEWDRYRATYGFDVLETMFPYEEGCKCTQCHLNKLALELAICVEDEIGGKRGNDMVDALKSLVRW